jgi:hypothetical protein
MRKLILATVALFGLFGATLVASADHNDLNRAWFFGDCDVYEGSSVTAAGDMYSGCHGFGIFFGDYDADSLAYAIEDEAWDEFWEDSVVVKLYAFKVGGGGTHFVAPIVGGMYGSCDSGPYTESEEDDEEYLDWLSGGVWIAWFEIELCEDID